MNCEEARIWRNAHLDDELDVAASLGMERHLADCAACRRDREQDLALRAAIRSADLYYDPPAALARKVRAGVGQAARRERAPSWFAWRWPAAVTLGAALMAALVAGVWLRPVSPQPLIGELVSSHVRSLQAGHLVDVASSDRHTVKPWFQGKLDFAPPVPDLPELAGGRLDYLNGRPVAALVYQRRRHTINVFVWPASAAGNPTAAAANGYQLVHWFGGGMEWWAVSDMNAAELAAFAKTMTAP